MKESTRRHTGHSLKCQSSTRPLRGEHEEGISGLTELTNLGPRKRSENFCTKTEESNERVNERKNEKSRERGIWELLAL